MKIFNDEVMQLTDDLNAQLDCYRHERGFIASTYIEDKVKTIDNYLHEHNLDTVVIASSGGIDSAVVTALATHTSAEVKVVTAPCFETDGVTRQHDTVRLSQNLCDTLGIDLAVLDLSTIVAEAKNVIGDEGASPWSVGQSVPYLRTAVVYSYISRLWEMGRRAVLLGTTNLDEGGYLGYIGKASDGMVDVQVISDIHKSEVYQVAKQLGVIGAIVDATPQGDMYSGQSDEEVFGASYDAVELFMAHKMGFPVYGCEVWDEICHRLESMHHYNLHKYLGASPAVHLDIIDHGEIDGGWVTMKGNV